MALNNPSNLYSGAGQVVNTAPHIAFQIRLLQQKAAKDEALDSYYRKLPMSINDKGVRDQDRPSIASKFMELKQNYLSNKEKIKKGDQAAIYNYEKGIRDLQDLVGKSQSAGLTDVQVGKLKFNPTMGYVFQDKNIIDRVSAHHLPVDHPEHVDLDLEELTLPNKPFDRVNYFKGVGTLKGNENIKRTANGDGTVTITNTPSYQQPQKDYILSFAADKYLHDASFKDMVDKDLGVADASNPLNADFKENFGHDIQTPIDLATAYTFNGLRPQPVTQKIATDQVDMLARRDKYTMKHIAAMNANALKRIEFTHSFGDIADPEGLAQSMSDAVKSGDGKLISETFHKLYGGKGNFERVEYNPQGTTPTGTIPAQVTIYTNEKVYDPVAKRVVSSIVPTTFEANDPNLIDHMRGVIVHTVGTSKGQKKAILSAPKQEAPKKEIEVKGKTGKKIFIPGQ